MWAGGITSEDVCQYLDLRTVVTYKLAKQVEQLQLTLAVMVDRGLIKLPAEVAAQIVPDTPPDPAARCKDCNMGGGKHTPNCPQKGDRRAKW